jgi:MOSC domain-containing protein YiiM
LLPASVFAVCTGRPAPFGPHGRVSAIRKRPVEGPVRVTKTGLEGDEQGAKAIHGGPEMAVLQYAFDHYADWVAEQPSFTDLMTAPACFGENISSLGLTEKTVCLGDVVRIGTTVLQVCQTRQPCWKLNVRFDRPDMASLVQTSARPGWHNRVLEEGFVRAGDRIEIVERPRPDWPLSRILHVLYVDRLNRDDLAALAADPLYAAVARKLVQKRLDSAAVEDWTRRTTVPQAAGVGH